MTMFSSLSRPCRARLACVECTQASMRVTFEKGECGTLSVTVGSRGNLIGLTQSIKCHHQCSTNGSRSAQKSTLYPPLGVEVIWEFQEFQELKLHKVISKDENASRKSKDEKCSIVVHSFCFELNLLMLNRSCSSNVQLSSSINS